MVPSQNFLPRSWIGTRKPNVRGRVPIAAPGETRVRTARRRPRVRVAAGDGRGLSGVHNQSPSVVGADRRSQIRPSRQTKRKGERGELRIGRGWRRRAEEERDSGEKKNKRNSR